MVNNIFYLLFVNFVVRGEFSREAISSKPGQTVGVLLGRQGAFAGLRVHGQRQLRKPSLSK